ncbi:MAG: glycosyltransferase family 2 protein [Anaeromyxobacter sp.]
MVELSVIIVTYNSAHEIEACLRSLQAEIANWSHEVFVVDNASKDRTLEVIRDSFPWVKLVANAHNAGFPGANNQAIAVATGELLLLLNPDTVVPERSIARMVAEMRRDPRLGICGPRLVDGDGNAAEDIRLPSLARLARDVITGELWPRPPLPPARVEALSGAALLVRRSVVEKVGLLDEQMFWREDVDYCRRALEAGFAVRLVADATIVHLVGRTAVSNLALALEKPISSEIAYFAKHGGRAFALSATCLLALQTCQRLLKWSFIRMVRDSPVARERVRAFRTTLRRFPEFYRVAVARYPGR